MIMPVAELQHHAEGAHDIMPEGVNETRPAAQMSGESAHAEGAHA
jgi:hypothetical protein